MSYWLRFTLDALSVCVGALLMIWFLGRRHVCKWIPVDAHTEQRDVTRIAFMGTSETTENDSCTHVLYRCRCGAIKTETLHGHWSLSALLGRSNSDIVESVISSSLPVPRKQ